MAESSNDEMVALWNGETSSAWVTNPERYDVMLRPFTAIVGAAPPEQVEAALASRREALTPHLVDGGVRLAGAAWLVTATKPG